MYMIPRYKCALVKERRVCRVPVLTVRGADDAAKVFFESLALLASEEVHALYLNAQGGVMGVECLARGGLHGAALTAREVFRSAMIANASSIVLAHNHPSGNCKPSFEDIALTRQLMRAGEMLGIPLMDHLVVCPETRTYSSVNEEAGA